ncbi:MAG: transcription antitermination factor NusB [Bacteroidales bacterium]|nr:transcription antitermination factor NusB [Bacteroidales bacterium]
MISRRILRIKVMQAIYAYHTQDGKASINAVEKELFFSINKTYDLYHYLLVLIIDIANYAQKRIELAQNKKLPSEQDLNPNTRFIDNQAINLIRTNNQLLRYLEQNKLNWAIYPEIVKGLYNSMVETEEYNSYISLEGESFQEDKSFIIKVYKNIIANFEQLYTVLEEQSIYWNDEVEFVIGIIIKTIKKLKPEDDENFSLLPLYKSEDDVEFTKKLFRSVILKRSEYNKLIEQFSKNWDFDRIAFMDILLLEMAITEAIEFPGIPLKVTFNEYIELSKFYSTKRSNVFINGILDKIFQHLKETKKIVKQGRGLIGDI